MKNIILFFFIICRIPIFAQVGWQQIPDFGTNPGNLKMYLYVPSGITQNAPVVVAMHGCTQNAVQYRDNSGWNTLADTYKFFVVYPEQQYANNFNNCFNWFLDGDQNRDGGEALSIKQMVDFVQQNYTVDAGKIFATGLSAGAGMTSIMLACYPDVFNAGAIMSGTAYKSATDMTTASSAMYGLVNKTPAEWMDLVIGAFPFYNGTYPRVAVFHGLNDNVVYSANINEIVEQWTAVHNISQTATSINTSFSGNADIEQDVYQKPSGDTMVLTYKINNMFHAIAVDPGTGINQGGTIGTYAIDKDFFSSWYAAKFFRILDFTTGITQFFPERSLHVFPNPAKNNICIFTNAFSIKSIKIYDITGDFIGEYFSETIDISKYSAGMYIAEIYLTNHNIQRSVFVKN